MIKFAFKSLACFLLILGLLVSVSSCANKKSNSSSEIEELFSRLEITTDKESDGEAETEKPDFAEHVYVIIPSGCSGELSIKANALTEKIRQDVGILASLKYDDELAESPKGSCEILIGNTNRLASKNAEEELKTNDYLCRWDNGALVICGKSDSATLVAIDKFISDILPTASRYSLMHADAHFELFNDYEIENITLNGYDLYDYVLVYDSEQKSNEREMAEALRDFINVKSGYLLDVISDDEIKTETRRMIKISASESTENKAVILSEENGISLLGNDSYFLSRAVAEFAKNVKNGISDGNVELKYEARTEIAEQSTRFKTLYYFAKRGEESDFKPINTLLKTLLGSDFGICFLGNPDSDIYSALDLNLNQSIKTSKLSLGDREVAVLYDESKLRKINISVDESGKAITAVVETLFGETLIFVYSVGGDITSVKGNSVVFAEQGGNASCEGASVLTNGVSDTSVGRLNYCLIAEDNVLAIKDGIEVSDTEDGFYCSLTSRLLFSSSYLNDAFK